MADVAEKWFRGYELGAMGLVTPEVGGIFGVGQVDVADTPVTGRSIPNPVLVRRKVVGMQMKCVVAADSHEELIRKLLALEAVLDPEALYQEFRIENRPNERTFARVIDFPVEISSLPFLANVVTFALRLERYPWWEDAEARAVTFAGATLTGTVTNTGTKEAWPVYTCTVTAALAGGLTITVGSDVFTYTGALAPGDVLVVSIDDALPDVTLNGIRDFANTAISSVFPVLAVGANTVTKSSAGYDLTVSHRRRRD